MDGLVLTAVENRGAIDAPDVRLSFLAGAPAVGTRRGLEQAVQKMLGLAVDPAPLHAAAVRLRGLRPTALSLRGMRPPRFATLFDAVGNVVPFLRCSLAARAARKRNRCVGRPDVFPPGDSGAKRGLNALLRLRTTESLARVVERFGEYRGYLYFCGLGASFACEGSHSHRS